MANRPTPYVKRTDGDIIRADEWNEVQIRAQEDIAAHNHTGGFGAHAGSSSWTRHNS